MRPGFHGAQEWLTTVSKGAACLSALSAIVGFAPAALAQSPAFQPGMSHPAPDQIGMIAANSPVADEMHVFHNGLLLPIIIVISLFVLALLLYVMFRFNEKANPVPSRTTHHTGLEVAWTVIPVMILVVIAIPSFRLLTKQIALPEGRHDREGHRQAVVLVLQYPKDQDGGFEFDCEHARRGQAASRAAAPARRRQRGGGSGRQGGSRPGHRAPTSSTRSPFRPSAFAWTPSPAV